jgi:chromate transporter
LNAALVDLFGRWLLIGALAFGGGQAALSLVERTTVTDAGWISVGDFSTAVAFSFVTPGPVLIMATFIGYRVAGIAGAGAATIGVFLVPWFLATAAAHLLRHLVQHAWLRAFGRGAGPAVVALLVVSAIGVTRATYSGPLYAFIALAALALSVWRKTHPFAILAGGALVGAASASRAGA